jgi:PAS domain S-box-containing protein
MTRNVDYQKVEFNALIDFEKQGLLDLLIVQNSDLAIKVKTLDGTITSWNTGAENIYGYSEKEIIGKNISMLLPPNHPNEIGELIEQLKNGKILPDYVSKRIRKDGVVIDVSMYISLIENTEGIVIGLYTIDRDITHLVLANENLISQNREKEKLASNLVNADIELLFQNNEKEKRANELVIANKELLFQNDEKEKRANELVVANNELLFQNDEKEKLANELVIANKELLFQNDEKEKRANELVIANRELIFQNEEKEKRAKENKDLETFSHSQTLASQYVRSLIEASHDPLFTINVDGKIMDLNQATVNVTGIKREELIGSDFSQYFTMPQKAKQGYQQVFAKGSVADYPLTIKDHNLTDVLFNGSVYKNENGTVLGAVFVARDITEQKIYEKKLTEAKLFAESVSSIAQIAKVNAENATILANDSVKAKQQFLSNMSHEIRTPLNAIIGFTKVVLKTELTAKQKEYLLAIKMSGDALIVLINDILDLAKVDAGKMTFEQTPFKMKNSIAAMLHLFDTKIQEKNITLIKEFDKNIPQVLLGDSVRLHQIILNLVSNAVKFTHTGSITVSVKMIRDNPESVKIEFAVIDTGIGIDPKKIPEIFNNFQQASSSTSRLFGGTGLGLAIVKQLVEAQNGTIIVESILNKGSRFSFILEFSKTDELLNYEAEVVEQQAIATNTKVLVVEDMALNQLLMKTLLDDFGFESDIANNGKIAIEKLKKSNYDIILMDLQMPEMNGFEATIYIRNVLKLNIPIIALTADVTTMDINKCRQVGMDDYLSKPVDERLLYAKMLGLINKIQSKNADIPSQKLTLAKSKCINLTYLDQRTKSNKALMSEMISVYLEQTPPLISAMKESLVNKDWGKLDSVVHKLIPSFTIMGMDDNLQQMAKKVQKYASTLEQMDSIHDLVLELEQILIQSCEELKIEFQVLQNKK